MSATAAPFATRVLAQARFEAGILLRNGEQLLISIILPVMTLVGLTLAPFPDLGSGRRIDVVAPGVLGLVVMSTAFTGQAIQTGFDRRYGVLRQLSTTPLGRFGLIAGKLGAILAVLAVQTVLICGIGLALGWRPEPLSVLAMLLILGVGAAVFTGLGLLVAGTLRAEATLAVVNLLWVLLAAAGGTLGPAAALPGVLGWAASLLPSAALGESLRIVLVGTGHGPLVLHLAVLAVWGLLSWAATVRLFRWS